jgi:putative flippase GtrA
MLVNYRNKQWVKEINLKKDVIYFIAVGAISTLLQYVSLFFLVEYTNTSLVLSSIIAYSIGALSNYLLNYFVTFNSNEPHLKVLLKFFLNCMVGLLINTAIFNFLANYFYYFVAQAVATFIVVFWNYFVNKYWAFKPQI